MRRVTITITTETEASDDEIEGMAVAAFAQVNDARLLRPDADDGWKFRRIPTANTQATWAATVL